MTSEQEERRGFKKVKGAIKKGPCLRDMELAVTDPKPGGGCYREPMFKYRLEGSRDLRSINAILRGMTRIKEDPVDGGGFTNNYLWRLTGGTELGKFCDTEKGGIDFVIEDYSPITRSGLIYFYIPEDDSKDRHL